MKKFFKEHGETIATVSLIISLLTFFILMVGVGFPKLDEHNLNKAGNNRLTDSDIKLILSDEFMTNGIGLLAREDEPYKIYVKACANDLYYKCEFGLKSTGMLTYYWDLIRYVQVKG